MSERMLITKLVRQGDRADLYARGHRYKDLTLFDLSDLADVGIDYANLETGAEVPCRFWAYWEPSDKLNKAGNAYKDVVMLEPVDTPATTTSTDTSALLAELRAIRDLLQTIAYTMGLQEPASHPEPPPEPPGNGPDWAPPLVDIGDTDENADWIASPDRRAEEAAIHDELARQHRPARICQRRPTWTRHLVLALNRPPATAMCRWAARNWWPGSTPETAGANALALATCPMASKR